MSGYDMLLDTFGKWKDAYTLLQPTTESQALMKKGYLEIIDRAIALTILAKDSESE